MEVLSRDGLGMQCRVAGKVVYLGALQPQAGTTIRVRGDRGRLVLLRHDAWGLGLMPKPATA